LAPVPSAHARSLSLFRGPRSSAQKPVRSPVPSLTRGARLSDPSSPNRPRSLPWTCPRPRDFWPRPHTPEPFLDPALVHSPFLAQFALSRAPLPSLSLYARAQGVLPPLAVVSRPFCSRRRAIAVSVALVRSALSTATRDAPRFAPPPLVRLVCVLQSFPRAARELPPSIQALAVSLPPFKGPRISPQGNRPNLPLILLVLHLVARNCSPKHFPVRRGIPLRRLAASPPFLLS
jgi:hypothetical protein